MASLVAYDEEEQEEKNSVSLVHYGDDEQENQTSDQSETIETKQTPNQVEENQNNKNTPNLQLNPYLFHADRLNLPTLNELLPPVSHDCDPKLKVCLSRE